MQIDLRTGVVPISRAASSLAALLKRCASSSGPVIVTQKGYPTGVLLSIDDYSALIAGAERSGALAADPIGEAVPAPVVEAVAEPAPPPAPAKGRPRKKV
jgi:prevent-host-death family protein